MDQELPPVVIIGGGFSALVAARLLQKDSIPVAIYERLGCLGGVWLSIANSTSKVQSEHATYSGLLGDILPDHSGEVFPSRATVCRYAQEVAQRHGLDKLTHVYTEVERIEPKGDIYSCYVRNLSTSESASFKCQGSIAFPGFFPLPNRYMWPGEESFAGRMCYGVCNDIDPNYMKMRAVVVIGHGAFAVESIRTAVECGADKVSMLSSRHSLVFSRSCGFLFNAGPGCSMDHAVRCADPFYSRIGMEAASLPTLRQTPNGVIMSQRNAPMSDIYFIAQSSGLCTQYDALPSRFYRDCVRLSTGQTVEADIVVKSLGADLTSRSKLDTVYDLQTLNGFWVNSSPANMIFVTSSRSVGVKAIGSTSNILPVMHAVCAYVHFRFNPDEFALIFESLPSITSLAEPTGLLGTLGLISSLPGLRERMGLIDELKMWRTWEIYSSSEDSIKAEWRAYAGSQVGKGRETTPGIVRRPREN